MLLLLTGSIDGTSDLIVNKLGKHVFRFNFDLFRDYKVVLTPDHWSIENPSGLKIDSTTATHAFWWKAFNFYLPDEEPFIVEEVKYVFRELYNYFQSRGLAKGNPPDFHNRAGKLNLLTTAREYFAIPQTCVAWGCLENTGFNGSRTVAKSLASGLTTTNKALFTTEVDTGELDENFPWYLQELIEAKYDVTVFICGNKQSAFRRDRAKLKGLDWRSEQSLETDTEEWGQFDLNHGETKSIDEFMKAVGSDWGRIDFMQTHKELVFLEYNANGQWLFLDYSGKAGLVNEVANYLSS